ncbi:MAG: LLM class flavin-dependent oxidoreductase [Rhodocyclaceae bacterium]|nr:LLM class flavin-dependent oxidoreductase [Rhodocyclaceae bacterium]MBK6553761.1 LLM class flavin-dependent oxidoreductase [Rhodocyclaceae bacterium]MBK6678301.1 LLM class flavin-dependent oxidoreductase [Rhodocyclaceae bacterium]MBK9310961.1 LLM class flavin-dependent oxidoreductase [Rhodocyclaceae bacterium]
MAQWILRLDLRSPEFAGENKSRFPTGLEMAACAEEIGFDQCMLSEHHGAADGYLPSPLVYGAAIAARTSRLKLSISALILPLHDPLRIAEDAAVLDHIAQGRLELVLVAGFLPSEFEMFDRSLAQRGALLEEHVAVLRRAWRGEPFEYRGRMVRVTPRPWRPSGPPLLLGGATPLAARRAARHGDGFVAGVAGLYEIYAATCAELGKPAAPAPVFGPLAVFVSDDPDATWQRIAPHALHETNSYARWYAEGSIPGPYGHYDDADSLRASGLYQVLTPAQCIELAHRLGPQGQMFVHPLLAGLDPAIGWQTLRLLKEQVMPALSDP